MTAGRVEGSRIIFITRHGESDFNRAGRIGGDGDLSENGNKFAVELAKFIDSLNISDLTVWTSTYKRTKQTARHIRCESIEHRADLDELNGGICDGLTYEEIADQYPQEFAQRDQDKYRYKYPKGESYEDVLKRLESVYAEMIERNNLVIVCHQAVARCLFAKLLKTPNEELPYIQVRLHSIFKITIDGHSQLQSIEEIHLPIDAIDTQRWKPDNVSENRTLDDALSTVPPHSP